MKVRRKKGIGNSNFVFESYFPKRGVIHTDLAHSFEMKTSSLSLLLLPAVLAHQGHGEPEDGPTNYAERHVSDHLLSLRHVLTFKFCWDRWLWSTTCKVFPECRENMSYINIILSLVTPLTLRASFNFMI
jgi:hypothetical protein